MARWLRRVLIRIHEFAVGGKVRLTAKADRELVTLGLGLDPDDVRELLVSLTSADCAGRQVSRATGEWMYLFKSPVCGKLVYVKLILRSDAWLYLSTKTKKVDMKKASNHKLTRHRIGRVLPDDACPSCGTMMKQTRSRLRLPVNGEEIIVPSASHLKCSKCSEVVLRFLEAKRLHEDAIAIYRKKHGLLSADQIRAIREQFGLTQADLARLLRLGANSVSRWESGRNVQTAAMDILLRLIRDLPGSIDYLRHHAA